jgi:membrane protein DedA with SNARE-associated domain
VLEGLLDWLASLPTVPAYAILMLLSSLENVFPPVPADVAVTLGAFLAYRNQSSVVLLAILCWVANLGSAAWTYDVARRHGPEFFRVGWGRLVMPRSVLRSLEEFYARYGVLGIFLSRFLPGLRAGVTPFAGVAGVSPTRALVPAALASALWYAFLASAGYTLADNWARARTFVEGANRALGVLAVVVTVVLGLWLWRRSRTKRPEAADEDERG